MKGFLTKFAVVVAAVVIMATTAVAADLSNILVIGDTAIDITNFFSNPEAAENLVNQIMADQGITSMTDIWYRTSEGDYLNVATNQMVPNSDNEITARIVTYYDSSLQKVDIEGGFYVVPGGVY